MKTRQMRFGKAEKGTALRAPKGKLGQEGRFDSQIPREFWDQKLDIHSWTKMRCRAENRIDGKTDVW